MARQEKGSRARGLPPLVRMQILEAATGSFPTVSRTPVDNRTGRYFTAFDDSKMIHYGPSVPLVLNTAGLNPGVDHSFSNYSSNGILAWYSAEDTTFFADGTGSGSVILYDNINGLNLESTYDGYIYQPGLFIGAPGTYYSGTTYANNYSLYMQTYTGGSGYDFRRDDGPLMNFAPNGSFSVSFYLGAVMQNSGLQTYYPILWRGIYALSYADWEILYTDDGRIQVGVFETATGFHKVYQTDKFLDNSTWFHIAVLVNGSTGVPDIYVNGSLVTIYLVVNTGWSNFTSNIGGTFIIGAARDLDYISAAELRADLAIDQLTVFNRLLTTNEIEVLRTGQVLELGTTPVVNPNLSLGAGLPTDSIYLNSEITTNIVVSGNIVPGIGDKWIERTPGQDLRPFDDSNHPAMDGMLRSLTSASLNEFYATGSAIQDAGAGFQQALKDKTKIEIDLTPATNHSFGITNFTSSSNSFAMAYFNKTTRTWEGVGSGVEPINYVGLVPGVPGATSYDALGKFLDEKAVGFGAVLDNGSVATTMASSSFIYGNPIDTFGFPYHPKYSGSLNTTFNMSDYISEPFLLEKVVVYFSGSFARGGGIQPGFAGAFKSLVTFFILNETKLNQNLQITNDHILTYISGPYSFTENQVISSSLMYSSSRDLVTWLHIGAIINGFIGTELFVQNYLSNKDKIMETTTWSGQITVSGAIKNPIQYQDGFLRTLNNGWPNASGNDSLFAADYRESWCYPGRSGAQKDFITKRNWQNVISNPVVFGFAYPYNTRGQQYTITVNNSYQKNNPYILLPTDKLIFGWHISGHEQGWNYSGPNPVYNGVGPHLTFSNEGIHKIVLYGSHLRVGDDGELKEYHDTLNQLLTSNNIHEVIGESK